MNKIVIRAEVVAHSLNQQGDELVSLKIILPYIILNSVLEHSRELSITYIESIDIPFENVVKQVQNDPFIHIAWQKHHSGMQGTEYFTDERDISWFKMNHLKARDQAVERATDAFEKGLTKQIVNRYLEPFMWTTMLLTGSKEGWDNFFRLRNPSYQFGELTSNTKVWKSKKEAIRDFPHWENNTDLFWLTMNKGQAEIHMMDLAEKIYDAMNESTPKQLKSGEWHIPFENNLDADKVAELYYEVINNDRGYDHISSIEETKVKISTAMAARESYTVVGSEKNIDYQKQIELHDRLISQEPPHSSPFEHCARAMSDEEYSSFHKGKLKTIDNGNGVLYQNENLTDGWCNNIKGFIPYRYMIDNNLKM